MAPPLLSDGIVALRSWARADAPAIAECIDGDPEITIWLDRVPQPYSVSDARSYIDWEGEEKFAITDAESGRVLGSIGLTWDERDHVVEIGYWIRADARGRGCMTRAVRLAAAYAFESGAARVFLRADPENAGSCRVAEKAGFRKDGVLRSAHWNERLRRRQDWAIYSLLPSDCSAI